MKRNSIHRMSLVVSSWFGDCGIVCRLCMHVVWCGVYGVYCQIIQLSVWTWFCSSEHTQNSVQSKTKRLLKINCGTHDDYLCMQAKCLITSLSLSLSIWMAMVSIKCSHVHTYEYTYTHTHKQQWERETDREKKGERCVYNNNINNIRLYIYVHEYAWVCVYAWICTYSIQMRKKRKSLYQRAERERE